MPEPEDDERDEQYPPCPACDTLLGVPGPPPAHTCGKEER